MFRGGVKGTGCPLHSPVSPSLPLPCVTVCHHISTGLYLLLLNFHIECVDCVDDAVHCAFFPHINSKNIVLEKKRLTGF